MVSRILLLTAHFPPHPGGAPRWFYNIYRRLQRCSVIVITSEGAKVDDRIFKVMTVPWRLRSWTLLNCYNWHAYYELLNCTWTIFQKTGSEIVHAGRCIPEGVICWLLKRLFGVPYLCFVHGEDIEIAWRCREYYHMTKLILGQADLIVANSRFTRGLLTEKWKVPPRRVRILYPGVDTTYFQPMKQMSQLHTFTIVCPGRFQRRKGQDMLLHATALLRDAIPNLRCIFAGAGEDASFLHHLAKELEVEDLTTWAHNPTDDELRLLYQKADLIALPNREIAGDCEGFGIVLLEAQACGKPVLCGNSGGTKETLVPGRSGLVVNCTDPTNIAKAILQLYQKRSVLPDMGSLGRHWVMRYFDWNYLLPKAQVIFRSIT